MPEMTVRGNTLKGDVRDQLQEGMVGEMRIMSKKGDTRVTWNARDKDEVKAARKQFESLTSKGFMAYKVRGAGSKGEQIRSFDPEAQKIILSPPMAGGC